MSQSSYTISVDILVKFKMSNHVKFLANVSIPAAKRLREAYNTALKSLRSNPQRCPIYNASIYIEEELRYLLFSKRYRIVFEIVENNVYIYDVQDCRQDDDKNLV